MRTPERDGGGGVAHCKGTTRDLKASGLHAVVRQQDRNSIPLPVSVPGARSTVPVNHDRPKIARQIRLEAVRGSNSSQVSIQAQPG